MGVETSFTKITFFDEINYTPLRFDMRYDIISGRHSSSQYPGHGSNLKLFFLKI